MRFDLQRQPRPSFIYICIYVCIYISDYIYVHISKSGGDFCSLRCGVPLTSRQRLGGLSFEAPSLALRDLHLSSFALGGQPFRVVSGFGMSFPAAFVAPSGLGGYPRLRQPFLNSGLALRQVRNTRPRVGVGAPRVCRLDPSSATK